MIMLKGGTLKLNKGTTAKRNTGIKHVVAIEDNITFFMFKYNCICNIGMYNLDLQIGTKHQIKIIKIPKNMYCFHSSLFSVYVMYYKTPKRHYDS